MKVPWEVLILILSFAVLSQTNKPHIVIILIDDLGWNDFGFHGSDQIKTPNIDALAYSGMILQRHYVLPICTPTRSALLTGFHPIRTGLQGYPLRAGENRSLPLEFKLQPEHMKDLGYKTHLVGKWHLGFETFNHVPNHRGFDTFFGYYNGYVDYYNYSYIQPVNSLDTCEEFHGYDLHYNNDVYLLKEEEYATNLFSKRAVEVIEKHNESEPLYLYMSHLATHTGNENFIGMQAPKDVDVNKTYSHIKDHGRRIFAACLEELDKSVGELIKALKKKNMLENSIVLLMSDNGGHTVSTDMAPNWSSNWPLAGTKFTMMDGGIRGGALIWSPYLPKGDINNEFIHVTDWLPTLYSAAGGKVQDLGNIDGVDQWEALQYTSAENRDNILVNIDEKTGQEGIILDNRWKIIKGGFPDYGLYDRHWGKEENVKPNPKYDPKEVTLSKTGKAIRELPAYKNILTEDRIAELRGKTKINCKGPDPGIPHESAYISPSSDHRCHEYCIFDLQEDPCETNNIHREDLLQRGKKLLEEYKKKSRHPGYTYVDPASNPKFFGGVWMPWNVQLRGMSAAMNYMSQYKGVSLELAALWYLVKKIGAL